MTRHDHSLLIEKVLHLSPGDERICDLADLFKIFGDSTRMRILYALWESEMCVCALAEYLGMNQSAVSHQLKILRQSNLVGNRREGKTIYYFLADSHVRTIIAQGWDHLTEKEEQSREKNLPNRD